MISFNFVYVYESIKRRSLPSSTFSPLPITYLSLYTRSVVSYYYLQILSLLQNAEPLAYNGYKTFLPLFSLQHTYVHRFPPSLSISLSLSLFFSLILYTDFPPLSLSLSHSFFLLSSNLPKSRGHGEFQSSSKFHLSFLVSFCHSFFLYTCLEFLSSLFKPNLCLQTYSSLLLLPSLHINLGLQTSLSPLHLPISLNMKSTVSTI